MRNNTLPFTQASVSFLKWVTKLRYDFKSFPVFAQPDGKFLIKIEFSTSGSVYYAEGRVALLLFNGIPGNKKKIFTHRRPHRSFFL